jgi:hypothetical protein
MHGWLALVGESKGGCSGSSGAPGQRSILWSNPAAEAGPARDMEGPLVVMSIPVFLTVGDSDCRILHLTVRTLMVCFYSRFVKTRVCSANQIRAVCVVMQARTTMRQLGESMRCAGYSVVGCAGVEH